MLRKNSLKLNMKMKNSMRPAIERKIKIQRLFMSK
jgi:hypothetical protein